MTILSFSRTVHQLIVVYTQHSSTVVAQNSQLHCSPAIVPNSRELNSVTRLASFTAA